MSATSNYCDTMTILNILFFGGTFALLAWVLFKMAELDERKEELDKYAVSLDERASRLAINEQSAFGLIDTYNKLWREFQSDGIYTASYTETDSDVLKYTTDALMEAHAKKHLAATIAGDIVKQFKVVEDRTEDGRRRFSYKFKIAEQ